MLRPVFKDVETNNTIYFMQNNTDVHSLINSTLAGNYEKSKLNPREVYEICCYIARALLSKKQHYKTVIQDLRLYNRDEDIRFLDSVFLCITALLDAIDLEKTRIEIKKSISNLFFDLLEFISERRFLCDIQRESGSYFFV